MNKKYIAFICSNAVYYKRFVGDFAETDIEFILVQDIEHTRGREWSGYIVFWDAVRMKDLDEIIHIIKQRIKKPNI